MRKLPLHDLREFCEGYNQRWTVETAPLGSKFTFMEEVTLPFGIIGKIMGPVAQRGSKATVEKDAA